MRQTGSGFLGLNLPGNQPSMLTRIYPFLKRGCGADGRRDRRQSCTENRAAVLQAIGLFADSRNAAMGCDHLLRNIDPDFDDGFQNGIHPLFYKDGRRSRRRTNGFHRRLGWGLSGVWTTWKRTKTWTRNAWRSSDIPSGKNGPLAGATIRVLPWSSRTIRMRGALEPPRVRRDGETINTVSALVLRQLRAYDDAWQICPWINTCYCPGGAATGVCASASRICGPIPRRILAAKGADPVYRLLGTTAWRRTRCRGSNNRDEPNRLPSAQRQARRDRLRLAAYLDSPTNTWGAEELRPRDGRRKCQFCSMHSYCLPGRRAIRFFVVIVRIRSPTASPQSRRAPARAFPHTRMRYHPRGVHRSRGRRPFPTWRYGSTCASLISWTART